MAPPEGVKEEESSQTYYVIKVRIKNQKKNFLKYCFF